MHTIGVFPRPPVIVTPLVAVIFGEDFFPRHSIDGPLAGLSEEEVYITLTP